MIFETFLALILLALVIFGVVCLRIAYIHRQYAHFAGPKRDRFVLHCIVIVSANPKVLSHHCTDSNHLAFSPLTCKKEIKKMQDPLFSCCSEAQAVTKT